MTAAASNTPPFFIARNHDEDDEMLTHDDLLEMLRNDIATHDMLQDRRVAIENYRLFVDIVIQFDAAYEPDHEPCISDEEIQTLWVASCTQ